MVEMEDFEVRFRRYMPRSNDLTLVILKGHLLMKESVNTLLEELLPNPRALEPANPKLFLRICLLRALLPSGYFAGVLEAATKLNELRNKLAHHLEHPQLERIANEFLCALEVRGELGDSSSDDPVGPRLKRCIALLCGQFHGMAKAQMVIKSKTAM